MKFGNLKQNIQKGFKSLKNGNIKLNSETLERLLIWGSPALVIPFGRRLFDKDKPPEFANEIFLRDFVTYAIGGAAYLGPRKIAKNFLNKTQIKPLNNLSSGNKRVASTAVGLASNFAWCTLGSVYLAKKFNHDLTPNNRKKLDIKEKESVEEPYKRKAELAFTQTYKRFKAGYQLDRSQYSNCSKTNIFNSFK